MSSFSYRAILPDGSSRQGRVEAADRRQAVANLRTMGVVLLDVRPAADRATPRRSRPDAKASAAMAMLVGELAVLLRAGLPLDRALALAIGNIEPRALAGRFAPLLAEVREGRPLSAAMARASDLVTPTAVAMTEAGETNGKLADALARLAEMMESAAALRRLVGTSMIYPVALLTIAVGVVLLMLLFVVPQFETLMSAGAADLPPASRAVLRASQLLRAQGWAVLLGLGALFIGVRVLLARPATRLRADRAVLALPQLGALVRRLETARFARTLGALVEGQVALPNAVMLAQRTIGNSHMASAVERVADGVRQGGGLAAPLAAARIVPDIVIGFIRTGEESSELGLMLLRLADVLDRDVRVRLERLVAILTPLITVLLGAVVTGIVAAIMSAILGFNEMALGQ